MSVIRNNSIRRDVRPVTSSPYARPEARKSAWSLRGFLGYLNPLRYSSKEDEGEDERSPIEQYERKQADGEDTEDAIPNDFEGRERVEAQVVPPPVTVSPSGSGEESAQSLPATSPSVEDTSISARNFQTVSSFLAKKGNEPLNRVELAGLVHLLQGSVVDEEPPQPFRFSSSPRATTPAFTFLPPSSSAPAFPGMESAAKPKKTLSKNPNGVYRWQGGGSARPRNRYQSPAFGQSRSMPSRMTINPEKPTTTKKRRTAEEPNQPTTAPAPTSSTSSSSPLQGNTPASAPSVPKVNGVSPLAASSAPAAATSRSTGNGPITSPLRTSNLPPKASIPAVPSPLRQTWGQTDSSSPPHPAPVSKPTRAANLVTEILKEAAPRPKPDFLNPYQAASPVPLKPTAKKVLPRRHRAPPKPAPAEPKEAELSPQKIIEATVPKGSKRLRPPHDLEVETKSHYEADSLSPPRRVNGSKSSVLPHTNGINGGTHAVPNGRRPTTVTIEEVSDEDLPSPPKKQRPTAPPKFAARRPPPIIIEEVEDEDMPISESAIAVERPSQVVEPEEPEVRQRSTSPTATTSPFGSLPNGNAAARNTFGLKSSAPKAPSKLRYSFQADKEEKDSEKSHSQDAVPVPGIPTLPSFVQAFSSTAQTSKAALKTKAEVRAAVASMVVEDLPTFTFDIPTSSPGAGPGPSSQKARDAAKAISKSLLPPYNFDAEAIKPAPAPQFAAPAAPLPIAFDWSAAGMKKPEQSSGAGWTCTLCGLSNPGSATEQCTICEAPRPSKSGSAPIPAAAPAFTPPPAPTVKSFDWAGAGMKKPESSGSSTWTCSSCMLSNPASATDKCTVCDAPR